MNCVICDTRDAGHRYACAHCVTQLRRMLTELEDYAVIIATTTIAGLHRPAAGASSGDAYDSEAPINADASTYLDVRSAGGASVIWWWNPLVDDIEPTRSLPGSVHGIACWIRDEMQTSHPAGWTVISELRYLRTQIDRCADEQWIDELHSDIAELHRQGQRIAGDAPQRPLGACLKVGCDGFVYWVLDPNPDPVARKDKARCRACRRPYTGLDLVRLGVAEEATG